MKQANNNEMDLLLRSLAWREKDKSLLTDSLLEDQTDSPHLDADELSAYAERTLPAATRVRYTTHLADCARCRKIVAELAPVVAASSSAEAAEHGDTVWQTIRHFFSWPVLRFAVPALSLLAFMVVGLVVFRDLNDGMVARKVSAPESAAIPQDQRAPTSSPEADALKSETLADSNTAGAAPRQAKTDQQARTDADRSEVTTAAEAPAVNLSKDAGAAKAAPSVAPPSYAPEPAGAPAPKPQEQVAEARETTIQTQTASRSAVRRDQPATTDSVQTYGERAKEEERARAKAKARDEAEDKQTEADKTAANNAPDQNRVAKLHTLRAGRGEGAGKKADDEASDVRSVAGRRFLRQGSMWVDTAYKSGISLTHVARGSEQYRALIADEPAIRTVAEQLQGDVILIWKGRGYRIR